MRRNGDCDEHVAGAPARPGKPLAAEPDLLAVGEPGRNLDLELFPGRQLHPARRAFGGFRQRDRRRGGDIAAVRRRKVLLLELEPAARASTAGAGKDVPKDVLEAAEPTACTGASAAALEAAGPVGEGLKRALAFKPALPGAEALEALEARLALGVDLATVERLALVGITENLIGGVELGEAARGLRIALVGVWV